MEKELAQRILKEVAEFAIDCWDRDYVKYDLKENIYSLDYSLHQKYNEQLKLCINDAIEILNQTTK